MTSAPIAPALDGTIPAAARSRSTGVLAVIDRAAEAILVAALLGELALVLLNVGARLLTNTGFLWTDEVARLGLATLTFVGGALAYRRREHTSVRSLIDRLPRSWRPLATAAGECLVLLGAVVAGGSSLTLIETSWSERTPILALPAATIAMPLTLSMALIAIYAVERLWRDNGWRALAVALPTATVVGLLAVTNDLWTDVFADDRAVIATMALFFATVLTGLPVGFALIVSSAAYLWISGSAPMVALAQNLVNGTGNFVLLAIPFFVVAGLVMERGGLSLRLVRFVHALAGHFRGGLLQVMVISMYLVSGLSGAKSADVAAVGSVMRDMLRRDDYDLGRSTAALAASAAMGETIPPSIAMLILGSVTSLSMAALFIGGLLPAAVIALCLMVLIYVGARRDGAPVRPRAALRDMGRAGLHAVPPLVMPVILFAGILLGIATPTEVSSFAVIYGVALAVIIYREMTLASFLRTVVDGAVLTGMILFILAAASSFSWVLTAANLPQRLVDTLHGFHNSRLVFMLGSIVLLIVVGSLLEGLPALNIMAPLLMPLAVQIGVNPLHFGIVLIIAMGIGAFAPPAGVGFYVCCAVMRTDVGRASRAMLPFFVVLVAGLLVVALVPWLTLVLPRLFRFVL